MADDGVTCLPGNECSTNPCAAISCLVGNTCDPVRGECVPNADCYHDIYISGEGVITSPGYPASYPPDQRCLWVLHAESRMIVTVISVDLESSADCVNDVIAVSASLLGASRRVISVDLEPSAGCVNDVIAVCARRLPRLTL